MSIFSSLANYQQVTSKLNLFTINIDYQYVSEILFRFWHVSASYRQVKSMPRWEYTSYIEGQYLDQVFLSSSFLSLP